MLTETAICHVTSVDNKKHCVVLKKIIKVQRYPIILSN